MVRTGTDGGSGAQDRADERQDDWNVSKEEPGAQRNRTHTLQDSPSVESLDGIAEPPEMSLEAVDEALHLPKRSCFSSSSNLMHQFH